MSSAPVARTVYVFVAESYDSAGGGAAAASGCHPTHAENTRTIAIAKTPRLTTRADMLSTPDGHGGLGTAPGRPF